MDNSAEDTLFQFRLESIHVLNFMIETHDAVDINSELASMEFGFNFIFNTKLDLTNCKIHFSIFLSKDKNDLEKDKVKIMSIEIAYIYKVVELVKYILEHDGKQALDTGVLLNLVNVAYSTSRGIIYERTRGYGINNLPIPTLNVEEYVKGITFNKRDITLPNV